MARFAVVAVLGMGASSGADVLTFERRADGSFHRYWGPTRWITGAGWEYGWAEVTFPNNANWSQSYRPGYFADGKTTYEAEPSNWTTGPGPDGYNRVISQHSVADQDIGASNLLVTETGDIDVMIQLSVTGNFTNNGGIYIHGGATLVPNPDLSNNGLIECGSPGSSGAAYLPFSGGSVSGTGTIRLNKSDSYGSSYASLSGTLTQAAGHTISGAGWITATLTNNGIVNANSTSESGRLKISGATTNNNIMEASAGGVLNITGGTTLVTQDAAGQLLANGGNVQLDNGAKVSGGSLNPSANGGVFVVSYDGATLDSVTNNAEVDVNPGQTLQVTESLTNNGLIVCGWQGSSSPAAVNFSGISLSGTGTIHLGKCDTYGSSYAYLHGTLTQEVGHTISGAGWITATLTNNGIVNANSTSESGRIKISGAIANNNIMEASGGGMLNLTGAAAVITQGAAGQLLANGGNVQLDNGAKVSGGSLNPSASGGVFVISNGGATLDSVTNNAEVHINPGEDLQIAGSLVDNGLFVCGWEGSSSPATLSFNGGVLSGTGTIRLSKCDAYGNSYASLNGTLTQEAGHTISGAGRITAAFTNNGTVNANSTNESGRIVISGTTTNNGLLQASNGGRLVISPGVLINLSGNTLSGGSYEADANSTIDLSGSIITNAATVILSGINSNFSAINSLATNLGSFSVTSGRDFSTAGTLENSGQMYVGQASTVTVNGTFTQVTGSRVVVSNGGNLIVTGEVVNHGTLVLTGSAVVNVSGTFTNYGVLDLINGPQSLPANFVNHGTVLYASDVRVRQFNLSPPNAQLTIQSYTGHNYQLQRSDTLAADSWQPIGAAQAGTGDILTFADPSGATVEKRFYRIIATP